MENQSFSFTLYTSNNADDQIRVTVYRRQQTNEPIPNNAMQANFRPNNQNARALTQMLEPDKLLLSAPKTLVLVPPHLRVDSQPVPKNLIDAGVWRNIHIQNGKGNVQRSFSVVKIRQGAQFCFIVGYEYMLLGYLKDGLFTSLEDAMKYVIPVKIERRRKKTTTNWTDITLTEKEIDMLCTQIKDRLNRKNDLKPRRLQLRRLQLVTNLSKITTATTMIEHVIAAIEKNVLKISEKEGAHIAAKKVPIVSTFVGIFFGAWRAVEGDIAGAIAEVASGALADIPGLGTAASATIDVGLLAKDIAEAVKNEKEHKKLMEDEIEDLKSENKKITAELHDFSPESTIFGKGNYEKFFDESEISYTDDISKIHIRSSDLIDGIQIEYRFGGKAAYHGGKGGTPKAMVLDPNEKITTVEVSTYGGAVSGITFYTDMGRHESFGQVCEAVQSYELADGTYLAAIKGYDMFKRDNGEPTKICPTLPGNREVVPAIGFTAKF